MSTRLGPGLLTELLYLIAQHCFLAIPSSTLPEIPQGKGSELQELRNNKCSEEHFAHFFNFRAQSHTACQDRTATPTCRGTKCVDQTSAGVQTNPPASSAVPAPTDWVSHNVPVMNINGTFCSKGALLCLHLPAEHPLKPRSWHTAVWAQSSRDSPASSAATEPAPHCPQLSH